MPHDIADFGNKIQYSFQNEAYLRQALTHSSYAHEQSDNSSLSNERLEFLGDAVLSLAISEYLYLHYEHLPEGELSKIRARIVCEETLSQVAKKLYLGEYLLVGHGEEQMGGRQKASILSDAFEALLAAIFLDGGIDVAKKWVVSVLQEFIDLAVEGKIVTDYKTNLQEKIQKETGGQLEYVLVSAQGPDHDKTFSVQVLLNNKVLGSGEGKSKKDAEQAAAKAALSKRADEA